MIDPANDMTFRTSDDQPIMKNEIRSVAYYFMVFNV